MAVAFPHDDDDLALAVLVLGKTAIDAIFLVVGRLDIAAEIAAIDLGDFAIAANVTALHFFGHRLAQFVQQDESGLVGEAQVAGDRQRALALHFVAEDRNRREIAAQGELVRGEQRSAGDREILFAGAAAKARGAIRAAAIIGVQTAAMRANRLAFRLWPTNFRESRLGLDVRHAEHLRQRERLGRFGEEEMLRHGDKFSFLRTSSHL